MFKEKAEDITILNNKRFLINLFIFICFNIAFYIFITFNNAVVPFNFNIYKNMSHHYLEDPRVNKGPYVLLRAIGGWDAQWYLRIADSGYPSKAIYSKYTDPHFMGELSYAFFPLYPLIVSTTNKLFTDIELSAFIISAIFLIVDFVSLYYVTFKLFSEKIAHRTVFLFFFYPFTIFYRTYFTEGLFLFLLIWFCYFLLHKKYLLTACLLSLMCVTRVNGLLVAAVFFFYLFYDLWKRKISFANAIIALLIIIIPFSLWMYFCYLQTGDWMKWYNIQNVWYHTQPLFKPLIDNLAKLANFYRLPLHSWRESQIDSFTIIAGLLLLVGSKRYLKPEFWWICLLFWITPLLIKDTLSYSRYQMTSFPLFIYLAFIVPRQVYIILLVLFSLGLFISMLFFQNWYWVG